MPHLIPPFIRKFAPHICRLAGCLLLIAAAMLPQAKGEAGLWTGTGPINEGRTNHTATLLANGKVLVAGGISNGNASVSSELYDPATGLWTRTGAMIQVRWGHTATLLANGKVLVVGGSFYASNVYRLASPEVYDPVTGLWTSTGSMIKPRSDHRATLLANGKVLVTGNDGSSDSELYDPATGSWSSTGPMIQARYGHTVTLLANGKVLATGGGTIDSASTSSELYDPATGTWTSTGSMIFARTYHTATLLANGKVLVAWGANTNSRILASSELYDPVTGSWTSTGSTSFSLGESYTATSLVNGKVLVTVAGSASSELYDPATGSWTSTGSLTFARTSHTATLLTNGKVLVAGGQNSGGAVASSELYASDRVSGDYFYLVVNGAAIISGYRGAGGNVTIPATLAGLPVTGIDNNAFYGNTSIVTFAIPASIASIGNQAFFGCTGLTSIQLPEKFLTDIEYIGLSGQVAANTLIQGVADNLGGNHGFISNFVSSVISKNDNYGLSTKTDLTSAVASLASKIDLISAVAPLATKDDLTQFATRSELNASKAELTTAIVSATAPLASKSELASALTPLATKAELASRIESLSSDSAFIAALVENPAFMAALANQIASGPNNYGVSIKQNQTLNFKVIAAQTYAAKKTLKLSATSSAKLIPITYVSSNLAVATVRSNVVTLIGKGTTIITATQAGNSGYNPAFMSRELLVK